MRRHTPRASRVLAFASVALAVAATLGLRGHLARLEARARIAGPHVPAVVAVRTLPRGTVLDPSMVRARPMAAGRLPPHAIRRADSLTGRVLAADVAAGEVLTTLRIAPAGGPVAALVPPGLRAVAVTAEVPGGVVVPGDRVDVLATYTSRRPHTETVVEAVEVIRVTPSATEEGLGAASAFVVLVSPDTARRLAFAGTFAELSLAVVSAGAGWR